MKERIDMRIIAPLLVIIIVSVLVLLLEVYSSISSALWFFVFRIISYIILVVLLGGSLVIIYERTGSRKVIYSSIFILTLLGFFLIFLGILALFANLYLFPLPIIVIGALWVWFILSRYEKYKEASK